MENFSSPFNVISAKIPNISSAPEETFFVCRDFSRRDKSILGDSPRNCLPFVRLPRQSSNGIIVIALQKRYFPTTSEDDGEEGKAQEFSDCKSSIEREDYRILLNSSRPTKKEQSPFDFYLNIQRPSKAFFIPMQQPTRSWRLKREQRFKCKWMPTTYQALAGRPGEERRDNYGTRDYFTSQTERSEYQKRFLVYQCSSEGGRIAVCI